MVRKISYLVKISSFFVCCHLEGYSPCHLIHLKLLRKYQEEDWVCFPCRQDNKSDMQHSFLHNVDMSSPMELKMKWIAINTNSCVTRGWCAKFATGLYIKIAIVQKVYELQSCPFTKLTPLWVHQFGKRTTF